MLQKIFDWTAKYHPNQVKALEKRKDGSQWANGYLSWDAIASLPWQKLDRKDYREVIHFAFCDYYYIYGSHIGIQKIKLLSDFLDEEIDKVFLRKGNHGDRVDLRSRPNFLTANQSSLANHRTGSH
jgi:hypothetical protein